MGIKPDASQDEINKAYRKLTKALHPDKVRQQLVAERTRKNKDQSGQDTNKKPAVEVTKPPKESEIKAAQKIASDKQTRLSLIAQILRGEGRERYDHFMANGFPVWKGTNYYYNRYRPGLSTVLVGFFLVAGGGFHYLAMYMSWKRQREFVERYIRFARKTAWGENLGIPAAPAPRPYVPESDEEGGSEEGVPMPRNRRERRMQQKETKKDGKKGGKGKAPAATTTAGAENPQPGPQGGRKRVVAENGKVLLVDSLGDVYLEERDEEGNIQAFLLDVSSPALPPLRTSFQLRRGWR